MTCFNKKQREDKRVDQNMYELRKWIEKPLLKEVIYSPMSFERLSEIIVEICEKENISNAMEFFKSYEIEELETGLKNNEVNIIINPADCRILNQNTKRAHNIRFEKMAKASYIPINIKINGSNTEEDIAEIVMNEVLRFGLHNIFKVKISGYRNPDIEITRELFDEKIRIVDLNDNTIPKYDFIKISSEHPQDMIGAFIRKMIARNDNLSDIEKRALYLGTHALIKTSENKE